MVEKSIIKQIEYNGSKYCVIGLKYKEAMVPVILDWSDYEVIKTLNKKWHINDKGIVSTIHKAIINGKEHVKEIYMHEVILKISNINTKASTLHINRLGIDNRKANLMADTVNKDTTKNIKKKDRIIDLSNFGIQANELPSFVWYIKESDTHGDRFMVSIGDVKWKCTSSRCLSLRYKLEETKKYLRNLQHDRPDLFTDYSMNGDLNSEGLNQLDMYINISYKAGFNNVNYVTNKTNTYLKEKHHGLSKHEIELLKSFDPTVVFI